MDIPHWSDLQGERKDSLEATIFTSRQDGNYLARGKELRTEVISSAGLRKMACCNLAESFENSASVTVGYSDAVTGARQIRLLGLSGVYTQMLDEKPLFVNLSTMNDTKTDFNIASSLQMGESWSTVILGHVSGNFKTFDHNHDGFRDDPGMLQVNVANRWLYYGPTGVQVRFGLRALQDRRKGGMAAVNTALPDFDASAVWGPIMGTKVYIGLRYTLWK